MLIADLRHHMSDKLTVMYGEFVALCGRNHQAASLLSNLFWWLDVADKKYPERNGWIYKTAEQLSEEVGLTRRGYEKARQVPDLASFLMVGVARIELATPAMSTQCSTTELYAHSFHSPWG